MKQDTESTGFILIVNNDPAMRQTVSRYFSDHDFLTSCVSDWSEVKCTGNHPSLIIMDQPLGLRDGLDRLRSIRSKFVRHRTAGQVTCPVTFETHSP